jgi:hypothetical protein
MSEPFIRDYLDKIFLLEERVGAKVGYQSFHPFSLSLALRDPLALNKAAREIADFVGIKDLVVIAPTVHREDRAGHIDLGSTRDALFIEIADDLLNFPLCVLATLAHELSHRYLQVHGISCGSGPEFHYHNEILTDVTAVFLGLGKLMLNGCTEEKTRQEEKNGQVQTVTQVKTVGYLEPEQFTFVYLLVCAMRSIPPEEYESGLLPGVIGRVRECRAKYANDFFSEHFHGDTIWDELRARSDLAKSDATNKLNLLARRLRQLEEGYLATASNFLTKAQAKVAKSGAQFLPLPYDRALKFLLAVKTNQEISQASGDMARRSYETERHIKLLTDLLGVVDGSPKEEFKSQRPTGEQGEDKAKRKLLDSLRNWFQRRKSKPRRLPSI